MTRDLRCTTASQEHHWRDNGVCLYCGQHRDDLFPPYRLKGTITGTPTPKTIRLVSFADPHGQWHTVDLVTGDHYVGQPTIHITSENHDRD